MSHLRNVGIILLILDIILFIVGLNATDSLADQMSNFFSGRFGETTMWPMIGLIFLNGCNTRKGVGKDVEGTGEAMQGDD